MIKILNSLHCKRLLSMFDLFSQQTYFIEVGRIRYDSKTRFDCFTKTKTPSADSRVYEPYILNNRKPIVALSKRACRRHHNLIHWGLILDG